VREGGDAIFVAWRPRIAERSFHPAARNLANYLALRRLDLHTLQASLTMLGLSSLGRSEGHVMVTLDALHAALARICGDMTADFPPARDFRAGRRALERAFIFLAVVLDVFSREVIGYAIGPTLDARLPIAALDAALESRRPPSGCIHHSDRGSQPEFNRSSKRDCSGRCRGRVIRTTMRTQCARGELHEDTQARRDLSARLPDDGRRHRPPSTLLGDDLQQQSAALRSAIGRPMPSRPIAPVPFHPVKSHPPDCPTKRGRSNDRD